MLRRIIVRLVFPLAGTACLAAGYATAGRWTALPLVLLALLAWLLTFKWRSGFFPLAGLVLSVGLAAAGLFVSAPFLLMILGAVFALAGWDLVLFNRTLDANPPAGSISLLEQRHYRSLALALGFGLLVAVAGPAIRVRIPFGWMILLAIIALLSLEGFWRRLRS
jgi:hypothetical protein